MNYQELTVDFVGKSEDGKGYVVKIDTSMGYNAEEHIVIPENAYDGLAGIDGLVRGNTRKAAIDDDAVVVEPETYGEELFEALFTGDLRRVYDKASSTATQGTNNGLRIKLQFNLEDAEEARLAEIPWELMRDSAEMQYLSLNRHTPIVRYVNAQQRLNLEPLDGPLRVLVVMASPKGEQVLDLAREERLIVESWAANPDVEVTFLRNATKPKLQENIAGYHVLHYMGHGVHRDDAGGAIVLEDENGNADLLGADRLGQWVRGESLRLVVLNACETAKSDDHKPFGSVAPRLVVAGVPAVIAMQFPISDAAAIDFSTTFYNRLVAGSPVDEATARGRGAISAGKGGSLEWGTPILFMRAPNGQLFSQIDITEPGRHQTSGEVPAALVNQSASGSGAHPAVAGESGKRSVAAIAGSMVGVLGLAIAGFLLWSYFQKPSDFKFTAESYEGFIGLPTTVRFESVDPAEAEDAIRYREVTLVVKGADTDQLQVEPTEKIMNGWEARITPLVKGSYEVRARAVPFKVLNGKSDAEKQKAREQYSWHRSQFKAVVNPAVLESQKTIKTELADSGVTTERLLENLQKLAANPGATLTIKQWAQDLSEQLNAVVALRSEADRLYSEDMVALADKISGYEAWSQKFEGVRKFNPSVSGAGSEQLARFSALQAVPQLDSLAFCKSDTYCEGDTNFRSEKVYTAITFPAAMRSQQLSLKFYKGDEVVKTEEINLGVGPRTKRWNNVYASGQVVGRIFNRDGVLLAARTIQFP